jgi:hypothetical protein
MGGWLESYQQLDEAQQERVQRWLHLNKFIAHTLRISWEDWVNRFLKPCFDAPLDYSFMAAVITEFTGLGMEGQGVTFTRELDPSTRATSRVPLRAKNNLGRLSPDLQDRLAAILEDRDDAEAVKLMPSDVAMLQKILPSEKALAKLPKPSFRKLLLERDEDDVVLKVEGGAEILRLNVLELGAIMSRALV